MIDIKTKFSEPSMKIKPEMLVKHTDGSIGLVTMVTRKWVHVVWLINTDPGYTAVTNRGTQEGGHHFAQEVPRKNITPCPVGTVVTITQVDNG